MIIMRESKKMIFLKKQMLTFIQSVYISTDKKPDDEFLFNLLDVIILFKT